MVADLDRSKIIHVCGGRDSAAVTLFYHDFLNHRGDCEKTRYIWLKNPGNLTEKQKKQLGSLKDMNLKTVRAYNIKLSLQSLWQISDASLAESFLKRWYFWATHSKLKPMIAVAKTLKAHWNGIVNYFKFPVSNGIGFEWPNSIYKNCGKSISISEVIHCYDLLETWAAGVQLTHIK